MPKVFVGGLAWATNDDSLRARFEEFGEILSATVISDRETGRSRGFGFVEFADLKDAEAAVSGMRDQELDGRSIRVDLANDRPPRREYGDRGNVRLTKAPREETSHEETTVEMIAEMTEETIAEMIDAMTEVTSVVMIAHGLKETPHEDALAPHVATISS